MKKTFDNVGVHQVQAHVIELSPEALAIEVQEIRTDVKAWLRKSFDLTREQDQQLEILPEDFTSYLAESIAHQYEQRQAVPFFKEAKADKDSDDLKEIIISGKNQVTYIPDDPSKVAVPDFGIWIRYNRVL